MGRAGEYALLGLAKALESGMRTYLWRDERSRQEDLRREQMQAQQDRYNISREDRIRDFLHRLAREAVTDERYQAEQKRKQEQEAYDRNLDEFRLTEQMRRAEDINVRHKERLQAQQERTRGAEARRVGKSLLPAQDWEQVYGGLGSATAETMLTQLLQGLDENQRKEVLQDPAALKKLLGEFQKQYPAKAPPVVTRKEAYDRLIKDQGLDPMPAQMQAADEAERSKEALRRYEQTRSTADRVNAALQEQMRKLQQADETRQRQQNIMQGGQGGQVMLDPSRFSRFPQGPNATPADEARLGTLAQHFNTIMRPGNASLVEIAQAFQWWADNTPVAKIPLDIQMYAQGVPGAPFQAGA